MARLNVNPTRMELRTLKDRLNMAVRGHKLLKDKADETVRQFMIYIKENKRLREEVEKEITKALKSFLLASAVTSPQSMEEAVSMPGFSVGLETSSKNIMSVPVPVISITKSEKKELYPYSFASVSSELDMSISNLSELLVKLVELAEIEKTCNMLADEIEKNRRRVNALEYVMIPQLEETIKYITMKLDENERSNIVRMMKVKELIEKTENQNEKPGE
ncbi:MAG TPA: V-type ATP synthase subunit D [Clostridia bacterium]|jgi:V/A-type H+-transporting ATPase subunit D|nr:V-type ATP synthase subunit D [Clostridia bacterium]